MLYLESKHSQSIASQTFEPSQRISATKTKEKGNLLADAFISLNPNQVASWDLKHARNMTDTAIIAIKGASLALLKTPQNATALRVSIFGGNYEEIRMDSLNKSRLKPFLLFKGAHDNDRFIEAIFNTMLEELTECSKYLKSLQDGPSTDKLTQMRSEIFSHFDNVVARIDHEIELNLQQDNS